MRTMSKRTSAISRPTVAKAIGSTSSMSSAILSILGFSKIRLSSGRHRVAVSRFDPGRVYTMMRHTLSFPLVCMGGQKRGKMSNETSIDRVFEFFLHHSHTRVIFIHI